MYEQRAVRNDDDCGCPECEATREAKKGESMQVDEIESLRQIQIRLYWSDEAIEVSHEVERPD